jgi:formylglycine-generating enzyme required for sulfatase activity
MGSPESEKLRNKNETQHRVMLTQGFWLAQTEVTQAQWKAVMGSNPSSFFGDTLPVDSVSWNDATEFIKRLNAKLGQELYRLPTEAEWEYACRAGTTTPFHTGQNLTTDQANYHGNYPYEGFPKGKYRGTTVPVGSFPGNAWGLQEMHGNLWEWCQDWYSAYTAGEQADPNSADHGQNRVLRGGSWYVDGWFCRSATRFGFRPGSRNAVTGFRLARGQKEPEAENR